MSDVFDMHGKIVVVTGGTGLLGSNYVTALSNAGAKVASIDMRAPALPSQSENVANFETDITDKEALLSTLAKIEARWGTPTVLINNAAIDFPPIQGTSNAFESYPKDKWEKTFSVNVTGTMLCCQVFGAAMAKKGGGSIINIASTYGITAPDQRIYDDFIKPADYGAGKAAVINLTKYLASYWGKDGVRVNALSPGGALSSQNDSFVKRYGEKTMLGRMARPEEYCGAVIFLASDASSYMTGANLVVDGGWTAW